jgi:uncharacterized protein YjbJ (UPF0337 family)
MSLPVINCHAVVRAGFRPSGSKPALNQAARPPGDPKGHPYKQQEIIMNTDVLEGKWKQVRGQIKEWWGEVTDDDLEKIQGKSDRLVGVLQERYGYSRGRAKEEVERRMRSFNDDDSWGFLSGIILGALVGAAVMLFLAPQSGQKTMNQLRSKGRELADQAKDAADDLQHRASNAMTEARNRVQERV